MGDKERRKEAIQELEDELDSIEGVREAVFDDATRHYDEAIFFVTVRNRQSSYYWKDDRISGDYPKKKTEYDITANLRSVGRKIRSTIEDFDKANGFRIIDKPEKIDREAADGYDSPHYQVEVYFP